MKNRFSELFHSKGVNYYSDDLPLQAALAFFGFEGDSDLSGLGRFVSEEFIEALDYIDHYGKPVLKPWSLTGERIDYVRLSPEHRYILDRLQRFGLISKMVNGSESIFYHFVTGYVVSDSGIFCTFTLTAQTAYALQKYADEGTRRSFLPKFSDPEEPWYGATFYTEIQGGSDLGANKTVARERDDGFLISGPDKYFASNAGIADGAVVTARIEGSKDGAKGISTFFVPALRRDGSRNYTIRRLKDKLGTVAVPTGEVEFDDAEAFLLGSREYGIYVAMEILSISRIDDAIAAVGIARKAFWEACIYSTERYAFGKRISDHELLARDMVEMEAELEAAMVVSLMAAREFDRASGSMPPYDERYNLSRLLASLAKNVAAETSAMVTRYSMEIAGGIGFLEEFPMAKFHRDSIVTSIWEGTSNIQALEMLETIVRKRADISLIKRMKELIASLKDRALASDLEKETTLLFERIGRVLKSGEGEFHSKTILMEIGELVATVLMFSIADRSAPGSEIFRSSAKVYYARHFRMAEDYRKLVLGSGSIISWMSDAAASAKK